MAISVVRFGTRKCGLLSQDNEMPLDQRDWRRIQNLIDELARAQPDYFSQDKVISVDEHRHVVFVKSFGDQPIPLFAFEYDVNTLDTLKNGKTKMRHTVAKPRMPKKGDTVLIARHMGSRRLPKCIGILQSTHFVEVGSD